MYLICQNAQNNVKLETVLVATVFLKILLGLKVISTIGTLVGWRKVTELLVRGEACLPNCIVRTQLTLVHRLGGSLMLRSHMIV